MFPNLIALSVSVVVLSRASDARVLAQTHDVFDYGIGFDFTPSYA